MLLSKIFSHNFLHLFCFSAASLMLFLANLLQFPWVLSFMDGHYYSSSMVLVSGSILLFAALEQTIVAYFSSSINSRIKWNLSLTTVGWFGFFGGSVIGSPIFDFRNQRDTVNIIALIILVVSKMIQLFWMLKGALPLLDKINKHFNRFFHIFFQLIFMILYVMGSIAYFKSNFEPRLVLLGAPLNTFGAFLLFVSNLFLYEEYYGL